MGINFGNIAGAVVGGPVGFVAGGALTGGWTPWSHDGGDWSPTAAPPAPPSYSAPNSSGNGYINPAGPGMIDAPPVDQQGLQSYRQLALGSTSPWTSDALAENTAHTQQARDQAATQSASSTQGAQDQIAMSGGLRSGAAERAADQGAIGAQIAGQNASQEGENRALSINTNARQQQVGALTNLGSVENTYNQPGQQAKEFNVNAAQTAANAQNQYGLQSSAAQNAYNQGNYGIQSQIYGAGQLADSEAYNRNNQSLWDKIF